MLNGRFQELVFFSIPIFCDRPLATLWRKHILLLTNAQYCCPKADTGMSLLRNRLLFFSEKGNLDDVNKESRCFLTRPWSSAFISTDSARWHPSSNLPHSGVDKPLPFFVHTTEETIFGRNFCTLVETPCWQGVHTLFGQRHVEIHIWLHYHGNIASLVSMSSLTYMYTRALCS